MNEEEKKELRSRLLCLLAAHITGTAQIYNLTDDIIFEVERISSRKSNDWK